MRFFFDRNIGRDIPTALRLLGLDVTWHDGEGFGPQTQDDQWLARAGRQGWIVVTHDDLVRNQSARRAIFDYQVGCFVLAGGQVRKWDKVRIFARGWKRISDLITSERPPFVYKVFETGRIEKV